MKKANLSTETIVTIILAIAMLGIALFFIQNEFSKSHELMGEQIDQSFYEQSISLIDQKFEKNVALASSTTIFDTTKPDNKRFWVGVKNLEETEKNYRISITNVDYSETDDLFEYRQTEHNLKPGEKYYFLVELIIPEDAISKNLNYDVLLYCDNQLISKEQLFINIK